MPPRNRDLSTPGSAWRAAGLPCLAVLGIALPLTFASLTDQYLYDFLPIDLLPIYATAWLILAAVALPLWIAVSLALAGLGAVRREPARIARHVAVVLLIALAAAFAVGSLIYCVRTWLATFGVATGDAAGWGTLLVAAGIGLAIAATARGRLAARRMTSVAAVFATVGALSLVSLPILGWHPERPAARPIVDRSADPHNRPNILLLTIDALSAQHMSLYGASRPTTPSLAAFARTATTFDRAYANGNFTTPGIASILTGTRPWTHRALQLPVWARDETRLASLPALLSRSGYQMGYVSTNVHAGGAAQGFGAYFQFSRTDRTAELSLCTDGLSAHLRFICAATEEPLVAGLERMADRLRGPRRGNLEYDPRLAIDPALAWLRTVDGRRPVFLWVHLFPPHSPYAAPAPWLGRFDPSPHARDAAHTQPSWGYLESRLPRGEVDTLEARYDESVSYVDYYAGQFLRRALDLLGADTVIVVTADHGESFAHGYGAHTGPGLYDEIIHVPLIVKLPGQTVGRRSEALAEQVDIAPTLAELAGVMPPPSWEGRSLLDECSAPAVSHRSAHAVFSMSFEQNPRHAALRTGSVAVIEGDWKLVHYMGALHYPDMPALHDELYDLASDPGERVDRAASEPDEVRHLRGLIAAELARRGRPVR